MKFRFRCQILAGVLVVSTGLGACGASVPFIGDEPVAAAADPAVIAAAIDDPRRPELDTSRDEGRQPAEVLTFFGLTAGEQVLDLFAGGGYYSEILSRIVGPDGRVYTHNNSGYRKFIGDRDEPRYANRRLPNVVRLEQEVEALDLPPASLDTVVIMLAYHDIYYRPQDASSWPEIDGKLLLAKLYDGLKPGGVLGIVDHAGSSRMSLVQISDLHRIPEQQVVNEIEAAGFVLDARSDVLENKDDNRQLSVFDSSIRGKSDRFALRFVKPAVEN